MKLFFIISVFLIFSFEVYAITKGLQSEISSIEEVLLYFINVFFLNKTIKSPLNSTVSSTNSSTIDSLINKIYEFAEKMAKSKEDPEKRRVFLNFFLFSSISS